MKILTVAPAAIEVFPSRYGGMERMIGWLTEGLRALEHEVTILCKTGSNIAGPKGMGDDEAEFARLAKEIDFEVIIDFSHDKQVSRAFPDRPQVNTYQVMTVGWDRNPVFISKAQRHFVRRNGAPVIYYGLKANEYPYYEGPREDYLLYMGSLIREKRVHWVSELAERLGLRCKIAGPRWQPEYWPTLEKMEAKSHVEMVGDVGGQEKLELLQKAKCLVHPVGGFDWVEAGAIVVLEALMVGTPVIASINGCLPEYITDFHNGFVCNSLDEMEAVFPFLRNVNPYNCRLSVVNYFNQPRFAADYEKLAFEVIGGRSW